LFAVIVAGAGWSPEQEPPGDGASAQVERAALPRAEAPPPLSDPVIRGAFEQGSLPIADSSGAPPNGLVATPMLRRGEPAAGDAGTTITSDSPEPRAALSSEWSYQGQLKLNGVPVTGTYDMKFALLDDASVTVAGPICRDAVQVTAGLFTVELDFSPAMPFATSENRHLRIEVRPDATPANCGAGVYTLLNPPQKLTGTPYAMALRLPYRGESNSPIQAAVTVANRDPLGLGILAIGGNTLNALDGWAIGIAGAAVAPSASVGITQRTGVSGFTDAADGFGVAGWSEVGVGVRGISAQKAGVVGQTYTSSLANISLPVGVWGDSGSSDAVVGSSAAAARSGVLGINTNNSGFGITGRNVNNIGVFGTTHADATLGSVANSGVSGYSPTGQGVAGITETGYAIYGKATSSGNGVYGESVGGNGVTGVAWSANGYGVYAVGVPGSTGDGGALYAINYPGTTATLADGFAGVFGASILPERYGVQGVTLGSGSRAVYGLAFDSTVVNYGVYGETLSPTGYGGYFLGRGYFSDDVGIGTTTPHTRLHVQGPGNYDWTLGNGWGDFKVGNGTYGLSIGVAYAGGGAGNVGIWPKGNPAGSSIVFGNPVAGNTFSIGGNGVVGVDQSNKNNGNLTTPALVFGSGSGEGIASKRTAGGNQFGLDFYTNFGNRMSVTNTGNVGIGRQPTANRLEVEGNASKTAAGSWLANSDARIKRDIRSVSNALATLDRVRLVAFRYSDGYRAEHPDIENRPYLNVVAQEFAEVFPDYVKSSGEKLANGGEILQVDTHPLTIYSAAAIQELHAELRNKDREIVELRARLDRLERAVTDSRVGDTR